MPKVSIIVPVYKVENYLEQCVLSLENQTLTDIEIILIDDGSPDNCPGLCDQFVAKDNRVKAIHKQNAGVSAARNDGLKIATGEYVIFCDADDLMERKGCGLLYKNAKKVNADIVIGDVYQIVDGQKKYTDFYANEFITEDREFIDKLIEADLYRTYCPLPASSGPAFGYGGPWNKLVRRALITDNNISFDVSVKGIFDDIIYTAYILSAAKKIEYVKEPVYDYRIIANSITHTYKPNIIEINDAIFQSWNEFFSKQENSEKYQKAYYACIIRRLEEAIRYYFVNQDNNKSKSFLKKELKELVKQAPYGEAIYKVDLSKLSRRQRLLVVLIRLKMTSFVFKLYFFDS